MKESDFQALYDEYHDAPDGLIRKKALERLHQCVYQYAIRRFQAEPDIASDFYLKMYERIEQFLHKYDPSRNISFMVYFSAILKSNYLKFVLQEREKEDIYHDYFDWDSELYTRSFLDKENSDKKADTTRAKVLEAMSFLETDDQITLRLHFAFYLLLHHIRTLLKRHQSFYFFVLYREYVSKVKEFLLNESKKRDELLVKMQCLNYKISSDSFGDPTLRKMNKAREELNKLKSPIPLRMVSALIKKSISQVHRQIRKVKKVFKHIFMERLEKNSSLQGIGGSGGKDKIEY